MRLIMILVVLVTALFGGCKTLPTADAPAPAGQTVERATKSRQEGFLQLEVLNARYDASNPVLRAVADPYTSQEERLRRVREFPVQVDRGLRDGSIKAAGRHTYVVCLWGTNRSIANASATGWIRNGTMLAPASVEDVTGRTGICDDNMLEGKPLGKPERIFRIRAEGTDARMTALQVPWSMLTSRTAFMVCSEQKPTVYPGGDKGLWVSPTYLNRAMQDWEFALFGFAHER